MKERTSRTACVLWMGNTSELKCHLEGHLCFISTDISFSILLLALADAVYCFISVAAVAIGKSCDSIVFRNSNIEMKLELNQLGIPGPCRCLMTTLGNACHLWSWVTRLATCHNTCYGPTRTGIQQRICNHVLTRARQMVDYAFGILTNKWRIFHRSFDVTLQLRDSVVRVCWILYSFIRRNDGLQLEDTL